MIMKALKSKIAGALTLGAFTLGIAGSSFAGEPVPGASATVSDYAATAEESTPDGEPDNMAPLIAAFAVGFAVAEVLHHHKPQTLPEELTTHDEAIFDQ
jgi:hypothetical protein